MQKLIAALKEIKEKSEFGQVLSEFPELIFMLDEKGTFLDFFAKQEAMLFTSKDKIIGKNLTQLFPQAVAEEALKKISEELQSGKGTSYQYDLSLHDSVRHFHATIVKESDSTVTALIKDITHVRAIELRNSQNMAAIRESEQRFRLLAEHLPGAVYLCNNDADYSMVYLNEKVVEITGYTPEEFISKKINFPDIYYPEDVPRIHKQVNESLANKTSFHLEYRIFHKSGELRWVEEFGTGVFSGDQLTCLEGYLQDISSRKYSEAKILEQNKALTKTNEELDRFVYSASHDLRSPLSSLLGLINLGLLTDSIEETKIILKKMNDRVRDMDHFIKEITYYAQNSRLDLEETEFSLTDLVSESLELHEHMKEAEGIKFSVSPEQDFRLFADARRLKTVLNNIIANAIKYSDFEKKERWVRISFKKTNAECVIAIEDNGVGIQCNHHDKIFNMFYRASERSSGSGLGLYIVKETLAKMNGRIEFKSVEGEGSVFTVFIPVMPI